MLPLLYCVRENAFANVRHVFLEAKSIVILVRADPKPQNGIAGSQPECTVTLSNPHYTNVVPPLFKSERRMKWITFPERIFLAREVLN